MDIEIAFMESRSHFRFMNISLNFIDFFNGELLSERVLD